MAEDLTGRTLLGGEYELREVLGRGGMATVYRARSRSLETDVAVKVLAPRLAGDSGFRERFHDEARSLAGLFHPNLVDVHHYGEEGDVVYIAMRLVPGGTLKDRLKAADRPLGLIATVRLIAQVADALQAAHDRGLVHLDVKPGNVLLGRADWPLLADFGITHAAGRQGTSGGSTRLAGTPLYMSPEQCRGGPVDGRSDQYSLAITAYEMLTGRWPFQAETTEALLQQHVQEPPPRPRALNPGIPGPVEDVLLRALSKAPEDRYPTVRDFAKALTAAAESARGIALETKAALAGVVPNLLAALALVLLGPFLLAILPAATRIGGLVPLAWPFQLLLAVLIAACLLGIRWQLIGLATRGVGWALDALMAAGQSVLDVTQPQVVARARSWRNAAAGSVEGAVNLAYLFAIYRLVGQPALDIVGQAAGPPAQRIAGAALALIVVLASLLVVLGVYRSGGPVVAGLLLALAWAAASVLAPADLGLTVGPSIAWVVRAAASVGALGVLLATRARVRTALRATAVGSLGPALAGLRPGAPPEEVAGQRRQLASLADGAVDFVYLLAGYALLRGPLTEGLEAQAGALPAAILTSGAAALLWLLLTLRLRWVAGLAGAALGVLLGAPLLVSLPILDPRVLGAAWPATVAAWVVGTALMLVLAALRRPAQEIGRQALGASLDHRLLGTAAAASEEESVRRRRALGGVAAALFDVGLLVAGYWALGLPAARALIGATGRPEVGSLLVAVLLLAAMAVLARPVHAGIAVLAEAGGRPRVARRIGPAALVGALAGLLVASCAAAPAALVAPEAAGALALSPALASTLVVDWEHWLPAVPAPEYATYNLALSCSDGRWLGQFREAMRPADGEPLPHGIAGRLGPTDEPCADWQATYFAHRRAAGLPDRSSFSWDWVDVTATVNSDETVDVVETHRILFTSGSHRRIQWTQGAADEYGRVDDLEALEGDARYPLLAGDETGPRGARVWEEAGQQRVAWWFPEVAAPAERVFTLRYRLRGALHPSASWRFERPVLLPDRDGPVWRLTVEVRLPAEYPAGDVRLASHGFPASAQMLDGRTAAFSARDVPPAANLVVVVDFPGGPPAPTDTPAPPTATPTPAEPTPTATPLPASATPTVEPTLPAETPSPTATPEASPSASPSATATVAAAPPSATATRLPPTATPTTGPTSTPTPSASPTASATPASACAGDEAMSFSPGSPLVGQQVTITVSASRALTSVSLTGPDSPSGPTTRTTSSGYAWDWRVTPSAAGERHYQFYAGGSTLCTTNYMVVSAPATSTPTRTPTPLPAAPTISSFSAGQATLCTVAGRTGQSTTLTWAVSGATTVSIDQGVGASLPAQGTATVAPTSTTTYTLTATNAGGRVTRSVTITVEPVPSATLAASPTTITRGGRATLNWSSSGAASANIQPAPGSVSTTGWTVVSPSATTTYTLTATSARGCSATASATITVVEPVGWTSTSATVTGSTDGWQQVNLAWSATGGPDARVTVTRTIASTGATATVVSNAGLSGSFRDNPAAGRTGYTSFQVTYTFTVRNSAGAQQQQTRTVTVAYIVA